MVGNLIQIMSHLPFLPGFINLASYFLLCSTLVNYTYMPKFSCTIFISTTSFCKDFIYLFLEKGREGERKSEKPQCVVDSYVRAPYWGPGLQTRYVPWLGIEPVILCFTVQHSTHWATPANAIITTSYNSSPTTVYVVCTYIYQYIIILQVYIWMKRFLSCF